MTKLSPTVEEIEKLRLTAPAGPVTITNLLKFHPEPGGRAAYMRYLRDAREASSPQIEIVHTGVAFADVGGGEDWDYVIIARYPNFAMFADTVTHPAWQASAAHRPDALARTVMIVSPAGDLWADLEAPLPDA